MSETKLVGILNVTPDSFSDGGAYLDAQAAVAHIEQLVRDGADVIDIGAESTRPGATPISHEEEWRRLEPVLKALPRSGVTSVDTRHAETARKALAYGVDWINDVSGCSDAQMIEAVRDSSCKLVVMHSLGVPADKNIVMQEADVVEALLAWARGRFAALEKSGIGRGRIIFDPGIGFGKTKEQSLTIIENIHRFHPLNVPIFIGHSRKSFLGEGDRDAATLAMSRRLADTGVGYLRVHDVAAHRRMLEEMKAYG